MNKDILKKLGFEKELERIDDKKCPFCNLPVCLDDFKDALSLKEFKISGICNACMDKQFRRGTSG